jgi:hypothetical protein
MTNKNILLIEPGYKNKYPPLGLMKIAQYHGVLGKNDNVRFIKGDDKRVLEKSWDRIYVTTLFSFEWKKISDSIDFALKASNGISSKVFVGGIAASLMHQDFVSEPKWRGIRVIQGLLDKSPAESLQLDEFSEELYADDHEGTPIEELIPDYSILEQIDYSYPVHDAYFTYASRGCVRKCKFCGVPKLEGNQRDTESISAVVNGIAKLYGEKKDLTLMDNNVVASPKYKNIISEIQDLGFQSGATIVRNGHAYTRRVDFNQGVDARILCKDPMYLREMSKICIDPLRIAFDHAGMKKPYEKAIRFSAEYGLTKLSNYMLYNFHDTPEDLYQRMRLNIDLNEELDIRIFSFPMRYQPVTLKDRSHIGEHWNRYYLRSLQLILQATHGIVSGAPDFFKRAFGETQENFKDLLSMPHHYIFNREWYECYGGKAEYEAFLGRYSKLTDSIKNELLELLSGGPPSSWRKAFRACKNSAIRNLSEHYLPLSSENMKEIWDSMKEKPKFNPDEIVARDERVEDAGFEI